MLGLAFPRAPPFNGAQGGESSSRSISSSSARDEQGPAAGGINSFFARAPQKQKQQQEAHGDGEEGTGAAGGGSKDQGKSGAADAAAVTAAELGEEIAQQIMETVLKVRRQVEGAGSTAQAACEAKVADCWLPSWVSGPALRTAFGRC